ncbi:MAG: hypothetical protein JXB39_00225 [Deltaproteobacteria bacterium]|nr:hypothetical protein [Deltaproteobacteria bacterium]
MNALPGQMLVDTGAPDGARAVALDALCTDVGRTWYPRHQERSSALARLLLFTGWHGSDRARSRAAPEGSARSLFGLEPEHVRAVSQMLLHAVYRQDLARFEAATGLGGARLRSASPEAVLEQATGDDRLAAALAAEVYRLGGPLPSRTDPRSSADTWFSRWVLVRGPERERTRRLRIGAFQSDAEHVLKLLNRC